MKTLSLVLIIFSLLNILAFAEENSLINTHINVHRIVSNNIEESYIKKIEIHIIPEFLNNSYYDGIDVPVIGHIHISVFFNAGLYSLRDTFRNIIMIKIMDEIMLLYNNFAVSVGTYFPFSILLANNYVYELAEIQNIVNEIQKNNMGVAIEQIFQNSIFGYFRDNSIRHRPIYDINFMNTLLQNNFIIFLDD